MTLIILLINRMIDTARRPLLLQLVLFVAVMGSGCVPTRGLSPSEIVKHPDSPMLIMDTKPGYVKVSIYDKVNNKMIEYGWVKVDDRLIGWTFTKYDWEKFIRERR